MTAPGPRELGRGVIVRPGGIVPRPWEGCQRVVVGPGGTCEAIEALHHCWITRTPVVVELAAEPSELRLPERELRAPYELEPSFELPLERVGFLVWANNYDARDGEPIWWHGRKAIRSGRFQPSEDGDVCWPGSGGGAFLDGGPADPPRLASGRPTIHRWNAEGGWLRATGHQAPQSDLAPDQLAAVTHLSGPARVVAPAGSGKTRVLAERLRHLVIDRGVDPSTVTALAFNTRAAQQLRERCADFVTSRGPAIRTLNSIALTICQQFGDRGRLQVIEEPGSRELVQRIFDVRRQSNADTVAPYLDALSAVRLRLLDPELAEEMNPDATGLAERFGDYRAALAEAGLVDFDEQIYMAVEILLRRPDVRPRARASCRRLLVDEFQDLNPAHMLLIRLLAAPAYDCFGVGDDDQVIYGYAGATPRFLLRYGQYFPGASEHALEVNYRCPPSVVAAARHLLSYNARRVAKVITAPGERAIPARPASSHGAHGAPGAHGAQGLTVRSVPAEGLATAATDQVASWLASGSSPADIAVLTRVNSALLAVQVGLRVAGIPCDGPLTPLILNRTGIRTALAYLRIGLDPGRIQRSDITETVRRPSRGIAPKVTEMITRRTSTSLSDVRSLAAWLTGRDGPKVESYAADLEAVSKACRGNGVRTLDVLRAIRVGIGLGDTMDALDSSGQRADRSTHADDLMALESVAVLCPVPGDFEGWLRRVLGAPPDPGGTAPMAPHLDTHGSGPDPGVNASVVTLATVHKMKGREWDRVVVFGASRGLFPHRLSDDEEEERRVFHVAITRARAELVVLADSEMPSPFVAELDGSRAEPSPLPQGPQASQRPQRPQRPQARSGGRPGPSKVPRAGGPVRSSTALPAAVSEPVAEQVEQALRSWRREASKGAGVPAYVVMNDRDLSGIAAARPRTIAQLGRCPGIGPIRLERYGDEILAAIEGAAIEGAATEGATTEGATTEGATTDTRP